MKDLLRSIAIMICVLGGGGAFGQSEKEMAEEYFKNGDCVKAISYYTTLLRSSFDKMSVKNYTSCVVKTKTWGEAESFFKKQIKNDAPNASWYYLYLHRF